jgi:hypothetical protein
MHAHQPERTEFSGEFPRQASGFEPVGDIRLEPGVDELADGGGDVALGRGDVWCACRLKVRTRSPGCLATEVDLPRIVGGGIQARR